MFRASEVSPRMFESDFIDFFSRTHWLAVPTLWLPVVAASMVYGYTQGAGAALLAGGLFGGFIFWTLTEYSLHRTFFHWEPNTWWGPKLHFLVHGVHHVYHKDPYRLVMPPAVSLGVGLTALGLFSVVGLVLSPWVAFTWVWPFFAGFVLGYVNYDCTHYILHHWKPRSEWMKRLRSHHLQHHHNHPDRKFGVSFMFWDRVFGTL